MKKAFALAIVLAMPLLGRATSITGHVALAGASTFTSTGINFTAPGVVLIGTGNFIPLIGDLIPMNNITFATAVGTEVFASTGIAMDITSFQLVSESSSFLNVLGTANMSEAGYTTTKYDFALTATTPDDVSSFTLSASPAVATIPEPEPLFLVGTGILCCALLLRFRIRSLGQGIEVAHESSS